MRPRTVSATSLESFSGCPRRFVEETNNRLSIDSPPGVFGTTLHDALQLYIEMLYSAALPGTITQHDLESLLILWKQAANDRLPYGSDYVDEGEALLRKWVETRPLPHEVISTEKKVSFDLVMPNGEPQAVTVIIDRLDCHPDGTYEVIDYKSWYARVDGSGMRKLIQPALYASYVRRTYGVTGDIIVSYDQLRHDMTSIVMTQSDIDRFDSYLDSIVQRIWNMDEEDAPEKLNSKCRYCPRKAQCETLLKATEVGWAPTMSVDELAAIHDNLKDAKKGIEALLEEVDTVLLDAVKDADGDVDAGDYILGATMSTRTAYDPEVLLRVLGPSATSYMGVSKSALDKELNRKRQNKFLPEEIAAIKAAAIVTYGEPRVTVTPKNPMDSE